MILAGDIGGTNTRLAFFDIEGEGHSLTVKSLVAETFRSREHSGLSELAAFFVDKHRLRPTIACFGIAGPVQHGRAQATNLPWQIDAAQLAADLKVEKALVINDLKANAYGIALLGDSDFAVLQAGSPDAKGNAGVIAAGTGLGEAGMFWDGARYLPFACEGGHADFAARNALECELLAFLLEEFGTVSWERALSGPGLHNLYRFFVRVRPGQATPEVAQQIAQGDAAATISRAAHAATCPVCVEALDLFVSLYGAEAGNLALKLMATGGLYVGGGIAPKNLLAFKQGDFLAGFAAKGRMRSMLEEIPIRVILSEKTALLGAARWAALNR